MSEDKTVIKVGADDGQGLLKINLQLLSSELCTIKSGRASYSDVNQLFVLSVVKLF